MIASARMPGTRKSARRSGGTGIRSTSPKKTSSAGGMISVTRTLSPRRNASRSSILVRARIILGSDAAVDGGALSRSAGCTESGAVRRGFDPRVTHREPPHARRRSAAGTPLRATGGPTRSSESSTPRSASHAATAATVSGSTAPSTRYSPGRSSRTRDDAESAGQHLQRQAGRRPEPQLVGRPRRLAERRRRVERHQPAAVDDGDAVRELLGLLHEVRGQQHGDAVALQRSDDLPGGPPRLRVHPGGRLVQEDQLRLGRPAPAPATAAASGRRRAPGSACPPRPPGRPGRAARAARSGGRRSWRTAPAPPAAASTARRRRPGASRRSAA